MRFDSYHPGIQIVFFGGVIACAVMFNHPAFLCIGWLCAFAYSVKLNGMRALRLDLVLIVLAVAFAIFYFNFTHFGLTELWRNAIGNRMTLESLVFGLVIGIQAVTVIMWLSCLVAVFSSDKVAYLLGRISPKASLMFTVLLRFIPQIKAHARTANAARSCIGMGTAQGSVLKRLKGILAIGSSTLSWFMESTIIASDSMKSRGYQLKGRRSFSIYRFDARDRTFVIALFICGAIISAGVLLDQTAILYDPEIVMNRVTAMSVVFYAAYALLCLMPLAIQMLTEARFDRLRNDLSDNAI